MGDVLSPDSSLTKIWKLSEGGDEDEDEDEDVEEALEVDREVRMMGEWIGNYERMDRWYEIIVSMILCSCARKEGGKQVSREDSK